VYCLLAQARNANSFNNSRGKKKQSDASERERVGIDNTGIMGNRVQERDTTI
jgi:hypothetical protein